MNIKISIYLKYELLYIVSCTEEQHAQNRRTEFKIVKIKS